MTVVEPPPPELSGTSASGDSSKHRNLLLRVASALILAPLAVAAAWWGGWPFAVFWGIAAAGVAWEWTTIVAAAAARLVMLTEFGGLALAVALCASGRLGSAIIVIVLGAAAVNVIAPSGRGVWAGAGLIYAACLVIPTILLRRDAAWGLTAILFLFAVVWGTDILGYVFGRTIGGPKLWPRVSPNKTWSGALAGIAGGIVVGLLFTWVVLPGSAIYLGVLGVILSVIAQIGDLLESALKRRFGTKDASHIIPGHGGLMDRLDGFIAATLAAVVYGSLRAGLDHSAQGLLQWTQ